MKKLPLGIQDFRKIIEGNYVYADKTQYIYELINNASYYFLSRPRRFGKSLLLDTIAKAFEGDKELFKGLALYNSGHDFVRHPVLRLDMSNISNRTPETFERSLINALLERAEDDALEIKGDIPSDVFKNLIKGLYSKYNKGVVVLIDEYDKPILDHLDDLVTAETLRKEMRGFYGILKSMDTYLRFTFITGVTKFMKTSVFSGLNNLLDITMTEKYAGICGIEVENLGKYFSERIEQMSSLRAFNGNSNLRDEILAWYDGYTWDGRTRVINPFSLLSFFSQERFASFWFGSGTPKFLFELIKKDPGVYLGLKNLRITELMLDTVDIDEIEAELLLFQTGYLTVKEVLQTKGVTTYLLDIPNSEVREALDLQMITSLTGKKQTGVNQTQLELSDAVRECDFDRMLTIFRNLYSSIPYQLHIDREAYYHSIFYAVMSILGFRTEAEVSVSGGRIDAVLEDEEKVYVIEFKYKDCTPDETTEEKQRLSTLALNEAMAQIKVKGYAEKYSGKGKTVHQIAFACIGRSNIEMKTELVR